MMIEVGIIFAGLVLIVMSVLGAKAYFKKFDRQVDEKFEEFFKTVNFSKEEVEFFFYDDTGSWEKMECTKLVDQVKKLVRVRYHFELDLGDCKKKVYVKCWHPAFKKP